MWATASRRVQQRPLPCSYALVQQLGDLLEDNCDLLTALATLRSYGASRAVCEVFRLPIVASIEGLWADAKNSSLREGWDFSSVLHHCVDDEFTIMVAAKALDFLDI